MKVYDFSLIERVKSRIDHPEDLVWQYGSKGFNLAVKALKYAQNNEDSISLKWDGTPSIIFGRNPSTGKFTITDKSGFGAKSYNGHPETPQELYDMLYSRAPTQPNRSNFAKTIASLWPYLEEVTPTNLKGYYQGDLLYVGEPDVTDNNYVIKPNKISYTIPVDTKLGQLISKSKMGIAVHSFFKSETDGVPIPVNDIRELQQSEKVLVIPPKISNLKIYNVDNPNVSYVEKIDDFIDKANLKVRKISDLGSLFGRYINYMASMGLSDYTDAPNKFITWLEEHNISEGKKDRIKAYIKNNADAYNNLWKAIDEISKMKTSIKKQLDAQENNIIAANIHGKRNHEGYVISTPFGKIKLVDRHIFMRKEQQ